MKARVFFTGLTFLGLLLGGAADARSVPDRVLSSPPHESREYRSGTIHQNEALALYSAPQRKLTFEACAGQFPGNRPLDLGGFPSIMKPLALCSDNFAVVYSQTSKTPLVVVERLTAAQLRDAKGELRTNKFYPDPRIPKNARAELSDYRGQWPAVHRGHQAPAADAPTPRAMAQSFALSNMVPQSPENNRGVWARRVEAATRHYVMRAQGEVYVFTGPAYSGQVLTVGRGRVWVPTHLYKLIYDPLARRAWAYWVDNTDSAAVPPPISYRELVNRIGVELLPGVRLNS